MSYSHNQIKLDVQSITTKLETENSYKPIQVLPELKTYFDRIIRLSEQNVDEIIRLKMEIERLRSELSSAKFAEHQSAAEASDAEVFAKVGMAAAHFIAKVSYSESFINRDLKTEAKGLVDLLKITFSKNK